MVKKSTGVLGELVAYFRVNLKVEEGGSSKTLVPISPTARL
jgi:hypothetical protein